jgi:hypothetical protein
MPGLSFISRRVQGAVAAGVPCVSGKFNRARDRQARPLDLVGRRHRHGGRRRRVKCL